MINGVFYKLDDYSLNWRLEDRSTLSEKVWVVAKAIFTLGGSIFAERHAAVCKEHPRAWGDRTLSYVENCPLLGGVVALIAEPLIWLWGTAYALVDDIMTPRRPEPSDEERRDGLVSAIDRTKQWIDVTGVTEMTEEAFTELQNSLDPLKDRIVGNNVPLDDLDLWEAPLKQLLQQVVVTESQDRLTYALEIASHFLKAKNNTFCDNRYGPGPANLWVEDERVPLLAAMHSKIKDLAELKLELLALA